MLGRVERSAADVDYLRGHNEALVVAVARRTPVFDRATIAAATGLTPQAVSNVLARLAEAGLVAVAGTRRGGVGKPTTTYQIIPTSRYAIGAHVARRSLRLVLTDLLGTVVGATVRPLPADFGPDRVLDGIAAGVERLVGAHPHAATRLDGVGIGMVGPLDHAQGVIRDAHGLKRWHDVPLRDLATARLGLPVIVDKDTTAAVTGEAWRRGAGFRDAALVIVESGIGAGLWLGGRAYRGTHTNAGEFGHTVVVLDGPRCVCGRHGCLEIVHARAADPARAARVLASGIVNLLQTIDVGHVVLAGADLFAAADVYLAAVETAVRTEVPRADWLTVEVTLSALGADVVAAGAATEILNARHGVA
jgi:predicted NBD/HSP70 family sugar kinase